MHQRAAAASEKVTGEVERGAGVDANRGKTSVYHSAGGDAPPGMADIGADVWRGDKPPEERGFLAMGLRCGTD